jgi:hypothetical protein
VQHAAAVFDTHRREASKRGFSVVETCAMPGNDRAGSLEQLLNDGWDYHDIESERLARIPGRRP